MEQSIEIVTNTDGQQVVSSRQVADNFGKVHKNVIASIREILTAENQAAKFFYEATYESRGKRYTEFLMNKSGFSLVAMGFTGRQALQWKLKYIDAFERMEHSLMIGSQPEILKRVIHLEEQLSAAGILRPFVAPRYTMENLLTRYKQATGIDRVRTFYDDIGKWCGVKVPYANSIRIPVRDWIIINLPLEHVQELVVGFETHTMARSTDGYPVSLNGCFGNSVEWDRTLREFDHKCAYCGESHETLMAEHIVPQSVMAREHPELCDSVFNIVPVCKSCNQSKGTSFMPTWFKKQPTYSDERYWKIQRHQGKYMLNLLEEL